MSGTSGQSTAGSILGASHKHSRNLVIVRAGDTSLHENWLAGPDERNWDILVSYFGDDPHRFRGENIVRIDAKGPKWPVLHDLIHQYQMDILQYDYIWLPDDDLAADTKTINRIFDFCAALQLELAQPALTLNSYISHPITLVNHSFLMRYTNFVEIMAPVFSRAFLQRCAATFDENLSGHGLDYLWPTFSTEPYQIGILDACQVRHTRPLGGPLYETIAQQGKSVAQDLPEVLKKYGLTPSKAIFGGLDQAGRKLLLTDGHGRELIEAIVSGYLPALAHSRDELIKLIRPILCFMALQAAQENGMSAVSQSPAAGQQPMRSPEVAARLEADKASGLQEYAQNSA